MFHFQKLAQDLGVPSYDEDLTGGVEYPGKTSERWRHLSWSQGISGSRHPNIPAGRDGLRSGWKGHGVVTRESQEAGEYWGGWIQNEQWFFRGERLLEGLKDPCFSGHLSGNSLWALVDASWETGGGIERQRLVWSAVDRGVFRKRRWGQTEHWGYCVFQPQEKIRLWSLYQRDMNVLEGMEGPRWWESEWSPLFRTAETFWECS